MKPKKNTLQHLGFNALAFAGFAASSAYADTALTAGHTIIDTTGNPALGVISRSTGATALFNTAGTATATGTPLVNGILGPWASIGTGTATRYATLDGSNNVISYTGGTTTTWGGTINSATTNYEISANGTATYGGSERVANTIRYTGGAGSTISLGNNTAFGLTTNGLINAGTAAITFQHGGGALAASGIHIGATQELVLNAANAAITVNARVHDGTGGASAVTVAGPNTVTLSAANTYTGPTTISAGRLNVISPGSIGTSAVSLRAATLGGNGTLGAVTADNTGAIITNGNSNTDTLNFGSLTFTTGATLNLNKANDAFTPALAITGNLATTSGITINIPVGPVWANGDYDLISFGTGPDFGPTPDLTVGSIAGLGGRQSGTLSSTGSTNGSIILTIGGDSPVWTGVDSQIWTTAPTDNNTGPNAWALKDGHTATNFWANDSVEFNDTYHLGSGDVAVSNSTVTIHGGVAPANVTFNNTTSVDYVIASDDFTGITTGALSKNGDGIVTLNTTNSYTGATVITDGTLRLGDGTTNGDIANSSNIANDGTLILNRSTGSFTFGNATSGFGEIIKNGAGTQIFAGATNRSGITTINGGTLQIGNAGLTGALGSGSITNNASLVFNRSNAVVQGTDFGSIDGTGSVTQAGTGAVTLSLGNSYSGGTAINSGILIVGGNNPLGTGSVTVAGGALSGSTANNFILDNDLVAQASTNSVFFTNGKNLTLNGDLSGSGNINRTAAGAAATVWLGGDNSSFSGTFTVDVNGAAATRFTAATAGSQAAKWVINQGTNFRATLDFAGGTIKFGSFTGTGFLASGGLGINTMEVGALELNETFSGVLNQSTGSTLAVTKVGGGTWTLTGTNTYTGDTTVSAGVLAVDGDAIPNAGKLVINGGGQVDPLGATEVVGTLYFGAAQQAAGTYGASGSGAANIDNVHFTGTGVVSVTTGPAGYTTWAAANGATGQTMDQDHDNDGVDNGLEYFIGGPNGNTTGFTALPTVTTIAGVRSITWAHAADYTGTYGAGFVVETSATLAAGSWTTETVGGNVAVSGNNVTYTFPAGPVKSFVRLVVSN